MLVPAFIIGLISSIITEIFKVFPSLSVNKDRKRLVALIIVIIVVFLYIWNTDDLAVDWKTFGEYLAYGLGASFLVYKTIVQTILEPIRKKIAVPKVPK